MYDWQKEIPGFREAWKWAHDEAGGDIWEDQLLAHSKNFPVATIVGLKMRKRFIENTGATGQTPIQIQIINVHAPGEPTIQTIKAGPCIDLLSPPADTG